jgi:hypothetical protein
MASKLLSDNAMKKHNRKTHRAPLSLGDLILAVSSSSRNSQETVAAVADLLESGRVCLESNGRRIRARVF